MPGLGKILVATTAAVASIIAGAAIGWTMNQPPPVAMNQPPSVAMNQTPTVAMNQTPPVATTQPAVTAAPTIASSGTALPDAAADAAVEAVRARLRTDDAAPRLTDITVRPLASSGSGPAEVVVCARLAGHPGVDGDIVARVLPGASTWFDPETHQRSRRPLVVMEAGPGLWRGGSMGVARQRYCGAPQPDASPQAVLPAADGSPGAAAAESEAGGERVVVATPVNVRAGPSGGSDVLFVAERGRSFAVLDRAPGGWVQVGDASQVAGWAHSSLLEPSP